MNNKLTEEIAIHILSNLGVLKSEFINTASMINNKFLLPEKIKLQIENQIIKNNIYGCQVSISGKDFKMLLADCSEDNETPEYSLLVKLKDSPIFGLYLICNKNYNSEVLIAVSSDYKNWIPCNIYLQATFLAGMEQIRDIVMSWEKCSNYQDQYNQLLSFIEFHHSFYGEYNEG